MRNLISVRLAPAMFTLAGSVVVGCYWASAQEAEVGVATGETRLETIVIEGGGGPSEGTASYTVEETDSATKLELTPRETPQTIVVVTNQIIEDFNLKDANEILKATPGVYVENERNVNSYQYFSRGYVLQTQFDGVPTASRVGDRDEIPPDSAILDRVEVIQGATGLLTGAGDPGGVVNFVRKMPTDTFQASIEGDIDSWLGGRLVGDISGPINKAGTIRGRLVAAHDLAESYIDYVENQNSLLYGVIQADVTETTVVTAGIDVEYYKTEGGAAYGNPTYHDGAFLDIPRSTNLGADWAQDRRHSQNYFLKVDQELPNDWSLQGQLAFANVSANFLESSTWGSVDPLTGLGAGIWGAREVWDSKTTSLDLYTSGPVEFLGREHELVFGFNGFYRDYFASGYTETIDAVEYIDVRDHDPTAVPGPDSLPWVIYGDDSDTETLQYGVFAAGRFNPTDSFHVILGGRLSWYELTTEGVELLKEEGEFTPYAGVVYDITDDVSLYASYASIFNPNSPDTKDITGDVLPPQVGDQYEIGAKAELFDGLNASLALFRIEQNNLAEIDPAGTPGLCNGGDCYIATGLVVGQGVEVGASGEILPGWNIFGGYTYLDQRYAAGERDGERFRTETPSHLFKLLTTYEIPDTKWKVGGGVSYRSETYAEGLNYQQGDIAWSIHQDGVFLVDLMAEYKVNEKSSALLTINNLFDTEYYSGISVPYHGSVFGDPFKASLSFRVEL